MKKSEYSSKMDALDAKIALLQDESKSLANEGQRIFNGMMTIGIRMIQKLDRITKVLFGGNKRSSISLAYKPKLSHVNTMYPLDYNYNAAHMPRLSIDFVVAYEDWFYRVIMARHFDNDVVDFHDYSLSDVIGMEETYCEALEILRVRRSV